MHKITLICDNCGQHFPLETGMDLPPYWIGAQIAIGNEEGSAMSGSEMYSHFCTQECFQEYAGGDEIKYHLTMVDREE